MQPVIFSGTGRSEYIGKRAKATLECVEVKRAKPVLQNGVRDRSTDFVRFDEPQNRFEQRLQVSDAPSVPFFRAFQIAASLEHDANPLRAARGAIFLPREFIFEREPRVFQRASATMRHSSARENDRRTARFQNPKPLVRPRANPVVILIRNFPIRFRPTVQRLAALLKNRPRPSLRRTRAQ